MAKSKVKPKKKHVFQDPTVEEIVEMEIEYMCPNRGKVKQKVKVKRLKPVAFKDNKPVIISKDTVDKIDSEGDLTSYDEIDESVEE